MDKEEVMENLEIARKYLGKYSLLIPDDELTLECFCLPSFGRRAFYAQVYMNKGVWRANVGYTHYSNYFGQESRSVHFADIERADRHPAKKAFVICSAIFPKAEAVEALLKSAEGYAEDDAEDKGCTIDGVTAGIRVFDKGEKVRDILIIKRDAPPVDEICKFSEMISEWGNV